MAKAPRARKEETPDTVTARYAQRTLGTLLLRVRFGGERITITRHGKPIAVLIGMQDDGALKGAA